MKRKNVANELVAAMREAAAIARGETKAAAVHQFPLPLEVDVRAVRQPPASAARSLRAASPSTRAPCKIGSRDAAVRIAPREPI